MEKMEIIAIFCFITPPLIYLLMAVCFLKDSVESLEDEVKNLRKKLNKDEKED